MHEEDTRAKFGANWSTDGLEKVFGEKKANRQKNIILPIF